MCACSLQDNRYLAPLVREIAAEDAERDLWDSVTVDAKKAKSH